MNILISNDDGIHASGLEILAERLTREHNVLVIAPDSERSAYSHSLSMMKPMRLTELPSAGRARRYSLAGSPADCVKLGLFHFQDFCTDVVVAGINNGPNLGTDVMYSGTVGCAREAAAFGTPGVAVSAARGTERCYRAAAEFVAEKLQTLRAMAAEGCFFNVNVPDTDNILGYRPASLGVMAYEDYYERSGDTFVLKGHPVEDARNGEDSDVVLAARGYITVTPLQVDATNYRVLASLAGGELRL